MAISRIRGEQIRQNVLTNTHIAEGAAIHETKLDVNWASHYSGALESKKVSDFVQVGNKVVGDATEFNLTTAGVLQGDAAIATSAGATEGVITDAPYNKAVIRDSVTGDSFLDELDNEVYGRIVHDGVDFKLFFYSAQGESEVAFTMPTGAEIDFQYMERFNLKTVSELFAANEKFVAGAADVTAFQNIHQLATDIYGAGYSLDRDGEGNLTVSLKEMIEKEITDREEAISAHKAELLAAGEAGKGANLIGIEDLANAFTAVTVEGALQELEARVKQVENSGGEEVEAAHSSDLTGEHATLDERLEADILEIIQQLTNESQRAVAAEEANAQAIVTESERAVAAEEALGLRATELETEVTDARGSQESLDLRLDQALNEDGSLKVGTQIHSHFRARYQATGGEAEVLLTAFNKTDLPIFQVGDDSLEVFINGQLQEPGLNYQEGENGDKVIFDLGDGTTLEPTDIVQVKYFVNNAQ